VLKFTDWTVNIRAKKHGLPQQFSVYVFLGDFDSDPNLWATTHNLVGAFRVLGRGEDSPCEKCKEDNENDLVVTGTVSLTDALIEDINDEKVSSLDVQDVVPYLERHLHWRVKISEGPEQSRDQVPGLKVIVSSNEVQITEDDLPVLLGEETIHATITDGRAGGFTEGDNI
jgi:tyrosinase